MKDSLQPLIERVQEDERLSEEVKETFANCLANTFTTTIRETERGDAFVITGDIPAMWLRDSSAQIRPLFYLDDPKADELILKVLKRQWFCLSQDSYANAFNEKGDGACWNKADLTEHHPYVWERKYELDSISYVLQLTAMYYRKTGDASLLDDDFLLLLEKIIDQLILEQRHENSPYSFVRPEAWAPSDTLSHEGKGSPTGYTGMSWSAFRPSDDSCRYHYLIPANAFAAVALGHVLNMLRREGKGSSALVMKMEGLRKQILEGIHNFGLMPDGQTYAYESDGLGNFNFMDDANIPSLLSLPYLGFCANDDPLYLATRKRVLSAENPYYYEGKAASGVGSPHTPENYIWHLALTMQALTASDPAEQEALLETLIRTDGGTQLMHEGFHKDNADEYTRAWFSWANSLFCELVLRMIGLRMKGNEHGCI